MADAMTAHTPSPSPAGDGYWTFPRSPEGLSAAVNDGARTANLDPPDDPGYFGRASPRIDSCIYGSVSQTCAFGSGALPQR